MVCHSLLQWTTFGQTSPPWPVRLGWPHRAWLSFIELDKTLCDQIGKFSVIMVSVCLLSDALSQHLPSCSDFSYLGRGVSLHSWSSKVQPLLFTLKEEYLLTAAPPDLEHGVAPLSPPAPAQPPLLGRGVTPLGHRPWPRAWGRVNQYIFLMEIFVLSYANVLYI